MVPVDLAGFDTDPPSYVEVVGQTRPGLRPLPVRVFPTLRRVLTEWTLTEAERQRLLVGERIRVWMEVDIARAPALTVVVTGLDRDVTPPDLDPTGPET